MADFTNNLAMVNGLAERTPGFVWRYIDESGNSTSTRPYSDPRIAINLSVWESVEALERFVYQTIHKRFYGRRAEWFEHFEGPYFVMWWVPAGHRPDVEEASPALRISSGTGRAITPSDWQATAVQLWKDGALCADRVGSMSQFANNGHAFSPRSISRGSAIRLTIRACVEFVENVDRVNGLATRSRASSGGLRTKAATR